MAFAKKSIDKSKFEKNEMNNVVIKDDVLEATLVGLFEGLTRKIPAFNYLRYMYGGPFNRISLFSIE